MQPNFIAIFVAALIPLVIGFVWYSPKLFANAWMNAAEISESKLKTGNMALTFILTYVFSILIGFIIQFVTIHQFGALGMVGGDIAGAKQSYSAFMNDYGQAFRSFKHGALHGGMVGILFIFPIIAINALFERKSWKYIIINAGYWLVSLTIMGGIICSWQ